MKQKSIAKSQKITVFAMLFIFFLNKRQLNIDFIWFDAAITEKDVCFLMQHLTELYLFDQKISNGTFAGTYTSVPLDESPLFFIYGNFSFFAVFQTQIFA